MPELEGLPVQLDRDLRPLDDRRGDSVGGGPVVRIGRMRPRCRGCGWVAGGKRLGRFLVQASGPVVEPEGAEGLEERALRRRERDAILRPARARQARLHRREVELDALRVSRLRSGLVEEVLLPAVGLDQSHVLFASTGQPQVAERLLVDREEPAGGPVFRRHVPDRRAVCEREPRKARAEVLDELAHDPEAAQDLRDGQNEIGRGRPLGQLPGQLEPDHLREQHRERLAEHRRLGLDPAYPPPQHSEPVHHRRVRVRPDERVRERKGVAFDFARLHHPREVLQVHLMDDAGVRRDHLQVPEGRLAPAQEGVALPVSLELELCVPKHGEPRAKLVHLHGVVDHELGGKLRVDAGRVAAEVAHGIAHGSEVDDRRHAGEVLEQDPGRPEGDLVVRLGGRVPAGDRPHLLGGAATEGLRP